MIGEQKNIQVVPVPKSKRLMSALIDYLPIMMLSAITNAIGMKMFNQAFDTDAFIEQSAYMTEEESFEQIRELFNALYVVILPAVITGLISYIYFFCKDLIGGQSPGKRMQKLQLVRLDGSQVSVTRMIVRNLFLIIWPIELIMYLANSGQRLGDILCKTTVVEATEENKQKTDTSKMIIGIVAVCILSALLSLLYYKIMIAIFDRFLIFIENLILRM